MPFIRYFVNILTFITYINRNISYIWKHRVNISNFFVFLCKKWSTWRIPTTTIFFMMIIKNFSNSYIFASSLNSLFTLDSFNKICDRCLLFFFQSKRNTCFIIQSLVDLQFIYNLMYNIFKFCAEKWHKSKYCNIV